jgi:hypothetical protein
VATLASEPSLTMPGFFEKPSQMLGPRPSTSSAPSVWKAAVATPQTKSFGKLARLGMKLGVGLGLAARQPHGRSAQGQAREGSTADALMIHARPPDPEVVASVQMQDDVRER